MPHYYIHLPIFTFHLHNFTKQFKHVLQGGGIIPLQTQLLIQTFGQYEHQSQLIPLMKKIMPVTALTEKKSNERQAKQGSNF